MNKIFILSLCALVGCAEGNCRQVAAAEAKAAGNAGTKVETAVVAGPQDHVRVFKYDGSVQCGTGNGKIISVEEMQTQLSGIKVFAAEKKMDGLMHMQMCGAPAGKANVYEIDRHQLGDATKLGFKEWLWN